MERRHFLKTSAVTAMSAALLPEKVFANATKTSKTPDLVAIYGSTAVELLKWEE